MWVVLAGDIARPPEAIAWAQGFKKPVVLPEAGEWLQQATLAIHARVPLEVLRDTIQPFPTFSEIYLAALRTLHGKITTARRPLGAATSAR